MYLSVDWIYICLFADSLLMWQLFIICGEGLESPKWKHLLVSGSHERFVTEDELTV